MRFRFFTSFSIGLRDWNKITFSVPDMQNVIRHGGGGDPPGEARQVCEHKAGCEEMHIVVGGGRTARPPCLNLHQNVTAAGASFRHIFVHGYHIIRH